MATISLSLSQFEQIDGLLSSILRMGPFETCADPRGYIRISNVLFDKVVDAMGFAYADDFASPVGAAAAVVADALLGKLDVVDQVAA